MLVSVNENNETVYADFAIKTDENGNKIKYYCPECGSELILRQGTKNIWHFAHKDENGICVFRKYDNESPQHMAMKYVIKGIVEEHNDCLVSELEYKIGSRIADYYFEVKDRFGKRKKVAVECVQHHTDIDEFRAKNEEYVKQGVYVIWLFNMTRFLKKNGKFKDEVRINEIIKEAHTMYFGKVYAVDINYKLVYGVHLDAVIRETEEYEYVDWSEWESGVYQPDYFEEHTVVVPATEKYLKRTKIPNPKLIKEFAITSFKRAWDKRSLKYLDYRRNVANVWMEPWW